MKRLKNKVTVWLWLLVAIAILQNCVSLKPSNAELQKRSTTIASRASQISDADAAVICYDMLTNCEKSLADTTAKLHQVQAGIPDVKKNARNKGIYLGAGGMSLLTMLLLLFAN
ncbi:hypothetical protein [Runella sp. SP2]|uniref:hypothetical protein n=1 Tax=Runella sp. SP2 TaxID=2268026 RepID=UPI0013DE17A1|nr:hypothetical protein [Runella sp. SP2]